MALSFGMATVFAAPALAASGAAGDAKDDVCAGITATGGDCGGGSGGLETIVEVVVNVLSIVAGIAAVIMIIFGGLRYITSGGDSSKVASGKNAIIYAIIGLVIVAFAQFIVRFVSSKATQ